MQLERERKKSASYKDELKKLKEKSLEAVCLKREKSVSDSAAADCTNALRSNSGSSKKRSS